MPGDPRSRDPRQLAEDFLRHESGKLIALLVRTFGAENFELAEDVVQEALARAVHAWAFTGVPPNPGGWITQSAKNLAIDALRRERLVRRKQADIFGSAYRWTAPVNEADLETTEIEDLQLRLIFVCCHPAIPADAQPALALKSLCGFGVGEIARAFLTSEAAIAKRLTRAKDRLRTEEVSTDLPLGEDLGTRLDAVHQTVYLLFNEGYKASTGDLLVRKDLCIEAVRLGRLLTRCRQSDRPRTHALLALMLFNLARLEGRTDVDGSLILLRDQDRGGWDQGLIREGMTHLGMASVGEDVSPFHLQAAIAATHCASPSYEGTNWERILGLYDALITVDPSPISALNRAVAFAKLHGPLAGLQIAAKIGGLNDYYLYPVVKAEFEAELGHADQAVRLLEQAMALTESRPEQALLNSRLQTLKKG